MTDNEIELAILSRYIDQHKTGELADTGRHNKCARELDMRQVIQSITSETDPELEYTAKLWHERLAQRGKGVLRPCGDSRVNKNRHRYHARAYTDGGAAPAWERVRELEAQSSATAGPEKEVEQKFRILYSAAQEQRDFDRWVAEADGISSYTIGVLFLDVDDFKRFNTDLTESVVDRTLLRELQQLVRGLCLHRGAAYRHGGEELLVLLPNCDLKEADRFAENLRRHIESNKFDVDGRVLQLTVSIGVAEWPTHGGTLEAVIEVANREERKAKDDGKNCVRIAACITR